LRPAAISRASYYDTDFSSLSKLLKKFFSALRSASAFASLAVQTFLADAAFAALSAAL
jgi:hypothetical protein